MPLFSSVCVCWLVGGGGGVWVGVGYKEFETFQ